MAKEAALGREQAAAVVAAAVRRLFTIVSEQQARELAALVLRDLEAHGVHLVLAQEDSDDGLPSEESHSPKEQAGAG